MPRTIAWIAVWGVLALGVKTSTAEEGPPPGHLAARCQWFRLDVVLGRIQLVQPRLGQKATLRFEHPETGIRESLMFSADSPTTVSLHYDYADPQQQFVVDVARCDQVTVEREPQNNSRIAAVRFSQPSRGELKLVVDSGQGPQELVADTLWHLLLAEPETCRKHLLPLLEGLSPGWRLETQARQVEESLWARARSAVPPDSARIASLVKQLSATDFRSRQVADRELQELGPAVLPYLERLDERELDAEQRLRLSHVRRALADTGGDTPARVAVRLASDPAVWLALLDRSDAQQRVLASQRLALLSGRPLAFDPVATAAERRQQTSRLRAELGLDRSVRIGSRNDAHHASY